MDWHVLVSRAVRATINLAARVPTERINMALTHPTRLIVPLLAGLATLAITGCAKNEVDAVASVRNKLSMADNKTAQVELKNLVQAHPKSGEARFLLGSRLAAAGDPVAAVPELERALEFKYPQVQVLPALVEAMAAAGQGKRALAAYGKTQLTDADAQAQLLAALAQIMASDNNKAGAEAAVAKALASSATSVPALLMKARLTAANDVPGALVTVDQVLASHPTDPAAWALKGNLFLAMPDGRKPASEALTKSLQLKPDQAQTLATLITLAIAQADMDTAHKQFVSLKKIAPNQLNTLYLEANLAYAGGDHTHARELLQALLRVLPDDLNILMSAGENNLKLGSTLEAEAQFAKAVALSPAHPLARRLLAQAQLKMGQPAKALGTLAPLVDGSQPTAEVLALAAQARMLNSEPKAADLLFARLAALKPTEPRVRTALATYGLGKNQDAAVFSELRTIAADDSKGNSADMALIGAHLQRGQFENGLDALASLEKKRPNDPQVQHLRGQMLAMKPDNAGARLAFNQALKLNARYFPSVAALAALDLREQQPDAARKRLKEFLKLQPNSSGAMLALAELLQRDGAPNTEVQKQVEAAVKASPLDAGARIALVTHHLSIRNAEAASNAALSATTALPESIELQELLGRCLLQTGQTQQALTAFGKVVTLLPKSPRGHVDLAGAYLQTNQADLAQRSISRALELEPGHTPAQALAISMALQRSQFDAALGIARDMQAARPQDPTGWLLEADVEMRRSHWAGAITALRQVLDKPGGGAAAPKLHTALLQSGQTAAADLLVSTWLKAQPADAGFLMYLGDNAVARQDLAGAERRYQQVLVLLPAQAAALNNLAMLLVQQKKPGAVELAERAVRAAPGSPAVLDTLALALASDGKISNAIKVQQRALSFAPDVADLRLGLARLLIQAGEKTKARTELDRLSLLGSKFAMQAEVASLSQSLGVAGNVR